MGPEELSRKHQQLADAIRDVYDAKCASIEAQKEVQRSKENIAKAVEVRDRIRKELEDEEDE